MKSLVVVLLFALCNAQRPPPMPTQYYAEYNVVATFFENYPNHETSSYDYRGTVAFDSPNGRMYQKSINPYYAGTYSVTLNLPKTLIYYYMIDGGDFCYIGCCNGYVEIDSWSWVYTSILSTTSLDWVAPVTSLVISSWSSWTSWDAKEFEEKEIQTESKEEEIKIENELQNIEDTESFSERLFNKLKSEKLGKDTINFDIKQCSGNSLVDLFAQLPRSRTAGLCNYNGLNGNLWAYDGEYNGFQTEFYCIQTSGNPLYIEYESYSESLYLYFDTFSRQVPEDLFQIPNICDCVA